LKKYFNNWSYKRLIQLFFGIGLIIYALKTQQLFPKIFGVMMLVQAVINIGCFSTRGCSNFENKKDRKYFVKNIKSIDKG
jgi:hypothetical protein